MKLNVLFLVLLLITSIKSNNALDPYSIEGFKAYLIENGLFEIIQSIKYIYGQDVAIISCEELTNIYNKNCKKLVIDYMEEKPENKDAGSHRLLTESYKNFENSDEEFIASSQSKEGSSKFQDSIE